MSFRLNPLIFPALVSTTVASSEATTLLRPQDSCGSCSAAWAAEDGCSGLEDAIAALASPAQDAAIPLKTLLPSKSGLNDLYR
jgi:hypothetical protein